MTGSMRRCANSFLILALTFCSSTFGGGPAGTIESLGAIRVNGRIAQSGTLLWGGESLQAPEIESAQVKLNEIGLISLQGGSTIKLAEAPSPRILLACLAKGDMTLKLNGLAGAQICAGNSIFAFSPGSSGRVMLREGGGRLLSSKGEVKEIADWGSFRAASIVISQDGLQTTPGEYKIQPYNFSFSLGGYADIEARSTRYLQFRVTDKDDRPAPDLLLLILLKNSSGGSSDAGSINYGATEMRVRTDQNGVVTARFDAGAVAGAVASFEVTIAKNNQVLKGNIRIVKPKGFWTVKNAGPVLATAAAIVVVAVNPFDRQIPQRPPLSFSESVVIP